MWVRELTINSLIIIRSKISCLTLDFPVVLRLISKTILTALSSLLLSLSNFHLSSLKWGGRAPTTQPWTMPRANCRMSPSSKPILSSKFSRLPIRTTSISYSSSRSIFSGESKEPRQCSNSRSPRVSRGKRGLVRNKGMSVESLINNIPHTLYTAPQMTTQTISC